MWPVLEADWLAENERLRDELRAEYHRVNSFDPKCGERIRQETGLT